MAHPCGGHERLENNLLRCLRVVSPFFNFAVWRRNCGSDIRNPLPDVLTSS